MQQKVSRIPTLSTTRHSLFNEFAGTVLDVGCGEATESIRLAMKGCKVYCVDNKKELLTKARKNAAECKIEDKLEFILADANQMSFTSTYFDVIMFKSSLHHVAKWKDVLSKAKEWLKTGGIIYLEEPLRTNPIASLAVRMYYSLAGPILNIHERPDPDKWPFDPRELLEEVEKHFVIEQVSYHGFISNLFNKATNYAKHPALRNIFQGLSNATIGIDLTVQSNPRLRRYCSMIIIQGRKKN